MNPLHFERFELLKNHIKKDDAKIVELRRYEISNIVGVSEGDSLKSIFKILSEYESTYSNDFKYYKKGKYHCFAKPTNILNSKNGIILKNLYENVNNNIVKIENYLSKMDKSVQAGYRENYPYEFNLIDNFDSDNINNISEKDFITEISYLLKSDENIFELLCAIKIYNIIGKCF